ncbi:MAG: arginase family protein [Candidatus Paceibacterota bacterium]|jgi:arginase family enzyme
MKNIIIGVPFDNGIRSMLRFERGITGADAGPKAVFSAFTKEFAKKYPQIKTKMLPLSEYNLEVTAKNIRNLAFRKAQKTATVKAQDIMTEKIKEVCERGFTPISIGGDHSVTYPLCRGLCRANPDKKVGVVYLDAHFDMRDFDKDEEIGGVISSGNAFRRLIEDKEINISGENVVVIGIHNTGSEVYLSLENYAKSKNVTIIYDYDVKNIDEIVRKAMEAAGGGTDLIYFSVDIDGVNQKYVSGVSAPAETGLTDLELYALVKGIAKDERVSAFDVAETSSRELAWTEIIKGEKRNETKAERKEKLERTARIVAKTIDSFLSARNHHE